jgi:hypothetical protein
MARETEVQPWEIAPGTRCVNCTTRAATNRFAEVLSGMDMVHGNYGQPWCEVCIARRRLEYAQECAAEIPAREAALARALEGETR